MVFYNMRLGQEGGKENAPFLQAVSISFRNETMREGPFADFTINYFKKVLSGRLRGGEKKHVAKSRREEAFCISLSLTEFLKSACMMQLLIRAQKT